MRCYLHNTIAKSLVVLFGLVSTTVVQADWTDRITVGGFATATFGKTDEDAAFLGTRAENGIDEDGSFRGTRAGLNISARLTDRISTAGQFIARNEEDNDLKLNWGFTAIDLYDDLTLRAGLVKFPVGIINEYIDVGYAYPWITPPVLYNRSSQGPQATREAYTGASFLWSHNIGDWTGEIDLYGGEVNLEGMKVKQLGGVTGRLNWNEAVKLQASFFTGLMRPDDPSSNMMTMQMEGQEHEAIVAGANIDWRNIVSYAEYGHVSMDTQMPMDADTWYAMAGYRVTNKLLPHVTYQVLDKENGAGHQMWTWGINYQLHPNVVLKAEMTNIVETDSATVMTDTVPGLFAANTSPDDPAKMYNVSVDVIY